MYVEHVKKQTHLQGPAHLQGQADNTGSPFMANLARII